MKKVILGVIIVMVLCICISSARAQITPQERETAINAGLAWLANRQNMMTGEVDDIGWPVALTALAVLKWEEHARRWLHMDPFNDAYIYKPNIVAGWKYIFQHAVLIGIDAEPDGNPDINYVNNKGVYFLSPGTDRPGYETGMVMMALEASDHKDFTVNDLSSQVNGYTYLEVMQDLVDYVSWAQNDEPNCCRGGWIYGAYNNGVMEGPGFGSPYSDNSVSQWPVLGLMSASNWGANPPNWVRDELYNHWIPHSQAYPGDGGFWYRNPSHPYHWENVTLTASGMIQLTYCGELKNSSRMSAAQSYIAINWVSGGADPNIGNLYCMYGVMKASMLAQPGPAPGIVNYGIDNWQDEYDVWIRDHQVAGHWDGQYAEQHDNTDSDILATEFALLILQKIAPIQPTAAPALTEWGLIIFGIVLLGFISWVFLKRRKVIGDRC
jgi:hypothetical protein